MVDYGASWDLQNIYSLNIPPVLHNAIVNTKIHVGQPDRIVWENLRNGLFATNVPKDAKLP